MAVELDEAFWMKVKAISTEIAQVLDKHNANYPTAAFVLSDLIAIWTIGANNARGVTGLSHDLQAISSIAAQALDNVEEMRGRDGGVLVEDLLKALNGMRQRSTDAILADLPSRPVKPGKSPWGWE